MTLATTLLMLTTLAAPVALAHGTHAGCASAEKVDAIVVHVDKYYAPCTAMTVSFPFAYCGNGFGADLHVVSPYHVLVLYGRGCQTGVINDGSGSLLP